MSDEAKAIHIWIGSNFSKEEEYMSYFELD